MFERILVPLDGSATAEAVIPYVRRLLRRCDAELVLVHAVPAPPQSELDPSGGVQALHEDAWTYIRKYEAHLDAQQVRARGIVRLGPEAETILDVADHEKIALIAMATHGRTGLERLLYGSVAEAVLRASPIPVLVVRSVPPVPPPPPAERDTAPFSRILLPLDGSPMAWEVVRDVLPFAKLFHSRVRLLHVVEEDAPMALAETRMRAATDAFEAEGIACDSMLRRGDPAGEILATARGDGADLIAMTTHGRSGLSRLVLGSVTEKVLRKTLVPLLVRVATRPAEGKTSVRTKSGTVRMRKDGAPAAAPQSAPGKGGGS